MQNVLPDILVGLMKAIYNNLYYKPVCFERHQVMAPTAGADAHDVIRSVGLRGGGA